jgi:hypothetical protein
MDKNDHSRAAYTLGGDNSKEDKIMSKKPKECVYGEGENEQIITPDYEREESYSYNTEKSEEK